MTKKNKIYSPSNALLVSAIFYIVAAAILFPFYCYQLDPDGVSYIGIAQKYLRGDFANAINGCWGPMISWLLVPFLGLGLKPLMAFKVLAISIGLVTLIQTSQFLKKLSIDDSLYLPSLVCLAIIILNFALTLVAPDILFACIGIYFVNVLLSYNQNHEKYQYGVLLGLAGAGLYLTKNYGLPFFLATFSLISFVIYFRSSYKASKVKLVTNFLIGMAVFGLVSFVWIALISSKYGYWTIGTAGHYNHMVFGPQSLGHPMYYVGLLPPPNATATSVWEDFSYMELPSWAALDSLTGFKFYLRRTAKNVIAFFKILNDFSFVSVSMMLVALVYLVQQGRKSLSSNLFIILLFLFVLSFGYLILIIEHRYLWLYNLLLVGVGGYLMSRLFEVYQMSRRTKAVLVFTFYFSFLLYPGITLSRKVNNGYELYVQNEKIKHLNIEGRIATIGTWHEGSVIAFYNDCQFYGQCADTTPDLIEQELETHDIDYLFVWKNGDNMPRKFKFPNITKGIVKDFEVYKIK